MLNAVEFIHPQKSNSDKILKISRCYDSHCHFFSTGEWLNTLQLGSIQKFSDLKNIANAIHQQSSQLIPQSNQPYQEQKYFRGKWLVGFGWDQSQWQFQDWPANALNANLLPNTLVLDQLFPDTPVAFSRTDGHALWFNNKALQLVKDSLSMHEKSIWSEYQQQGQIQGGVALEAARDFFWRLIPAYSQSQLQEFAMQSQQLFLSQGFTHLRDMECNLERLKILLQLEQENRLHIHLILNFELPSFNQLDTVLQDVQQAQSLLKKSKKLRLGGLKFYVDGALGSEGALLSQKYQNRDHQGLQVCPDSEIKTIIQQAWQHSFAVCVHVIGDQASQLIVEQIQKIQRQSGELHLEHVEVLRTETIKQLQSWNVTCHMQPSHWLSDKKFLADKLGPLMSSIFPWSQLVQAKIPIFWGSDSPIEPPSINRTLQALLDAKASGILDPYSNVSTELSDHMSLTWLQPHVCPAMENFGINSCSYFKYEHDQRQSPKVTCQQVLIDGQIVFTAPIKESLR
jgi:predicted amidohydrolase YtcJ